MPTDKSRPTSPSAVEASLDSNHEDRDPARKAQSIAQLARRAEQQIPATGRLILGLAGPPGVGKSTLAAGMAAVLGERAAVLGMDGFHLSGAELERRGHLQRKGAPDTFDVDGYCASLERVREDKGDVYIPVFDPSIDEPVAAAELVPSSARLVVTDGAWLLLQSDGWDRARALLDMIWFLEVDRHERLRRIARRRHLQGLDATSTARWTRYVDQPHLERALRSGLRANEAIRVRREDAIALVAPSASMLGAHLSRGAQVDT